MAEPSDIRNLLDYIGAPDLSYYEFDNMGRPQPAAGEPPAAGTIAPAPALELTRREEPPPDASPPDASPPDAAWAGALDLRGYGGVATAATLRAPKAVPRPPPAVEAPRAAPRPEPTAAPAPASAPQRPPRPPPAAAELPPAAEDEPEPSLAELFRRL